MRQTGSAALKLVYVNDATEIREGVMENKLRKRRQKIKINAFKVKQKQVLKDQTSQFTFSSRENRTVIKLHIQEYLPLTTAKHYIKYKYVIMYYTEPMIFFSTKAYSCFDVIASIFG